MGIMEKVVIEIFILILILVLADILPIFLMFLYCCSCLIRLIAGNLKMNEMCFKIFEIRKL